MLTNHFMENRKKDAQDYSTGYSSKLWRFDEAFEPYRQAFVNGDIEQQSSIMNNLVSSLVAAENRKLVKERAHCVEKPLAVEDIFTCKLCQELFHDPVTLACGHTFCSECLGRYGQEGRTVCPYCGQESSLHYTSNIVVRELLRMWFPEKTHIRSCIAEANKLLREQRMDEFMKLTKDFLTKYPENVDLLHLRAKGYQRQNAHSDALNVLDFACAITPFCAKVLYARGELLRNIGEADEAMIMFLRASALKPNEPIYRAKLTSCLDKHFRNICNSSAPYKADHEAAIEILSIGLPVKSAPNFEESTSMAYNMSRRRAACCEVDQLGYSNITFTMNSNNHRGDSVCGTNATERSFDTLIDQERSCYKAEVIENISQSGQRDTCIQRPSIVPPKLSSIPRELECELCFNLFYQPVTTTCGHTLCRACLTRSLDHRFDCPCCRTNLQSYLAHFITKTVGTCLVLERLCLLMFNDEYQARRLAYERELLEFSRCENNNNVISILVCTLVVPDIPWPLHIIEPSHKFLIRQCIESGSLHIGMCDSDPEQTFATVGTMLHINSVNFLPDGRSIVYTVGCRRFRVLERGTQHGYNTAKVAWIQDKCDESDYSNLYREVFNMMTQWFENLPREQKTCIVDAIGRLPDTREGTNENGPSWFWWLLAAIPLNHDAKRIILSMISFTERLSSVKRFLDILLSRL